MSESNQRATDFERALLGGLLLDPRGLLQLPKSLTPSCFWSPSRGEIFKAIVYCAEKDSPIDPVVIADRINKAGGDIPVSDLIDLTDSGMPSSVEHYAAQVVDESRKRQLRHRLRDVFDANKTYGENVAALSALLTDDDSGDCQAYSMPEVMTATLKHLEASHGGKLLFPFGFAELDAMIGGAEKGELVVVGGRPGMGKTALLIDLFLRWGELRHRVFFVGVEGTKEKIGARLLSKKTRIAASVFKAGRIADDDFPRIVRASGILSELPGDIIEKEFDWPTIKRKIYLAARKGCEVVFVDYLTRLKIVPQKFERFDVAVGRIVDDMKDLALKLNLVFVLACQFNREVDKRSGDHRPAMSDLRESGQIEQTADIVLFPFRPCVYDREASKEDATIIVAKARDTAIDDIFVKFHGPTMSFVDLPNPVSVIYG